MRTEAEAAHLKVQICILFRCRYGTCRSCLYTCSNKAFESNKISFELCVLFSFLIPVLMQWNVLIRPWIMYTHLVWFLIDGMKCPDSSMYCVYLSGLVPTLMEWNVLIHPSIVWTRFVLLPFPWEEMCKFWQGFHWNLLTRFGFGTPFHAMKYSDSYLKCKEMCRLVVKFGKKKFFWKKHQCPYT